ncbi:hypothetical protein [Archaeoglobus veneficus]|uniref:Uncharacterized protein n=1 Tax=Archaeoglobus veneficus (strain DSM 11195 / SNP6) TaxID=693661 RepID=F2KSN5_ARCVS|nr:hypothetical protein [Archaeoglobus veneficus]AEA48105.1 hypothetical protein Arcve_2116 [Archaeoglobus veneficus SNP6]
MRKEAQILKAMAVFHAGVLLLSIGVLASIFVSRFAMAAVPVAILLMVKGYRMGKE